tara:strand:- start:2608 stop:4179 length:1572 start_codon:yes stop_codon:yes gene_type:complete
MPNNGATTGQLFDKESTRIEEILSKQIDTFLPTMDPIWRDTVVTSQGVGSVNEFSKDFEVNKLYRTGMTGVIEQGAPVEDFFLYGDADDTDMGSRLRRNSVTNSFPDPLDGPKQKTFRMTVAMRAMYTNLSLTLGEMQMDATPAVVDSVISPILQGFAQNLSHTLCNYWYLSQNDSYRLGTVGTLATGHTTTNGSGGATDTAGSIKSIRINTTEGAYDRFFTGQRVDIYNSAGAVRINDDGDGSADGYKPCYVASVDDLKGEVVIVTPAGLNADIASGMLIVYANSGEERNKEETAAFTGIAGINSWLKSTGSLLGSEAHGTNAIDVDEHPEFKSFFKSGVGVLTEHKLRQYLRRFHVAKSKLGQTIDSLVASDGVWLSYEAQKIGQYQIERSGNLSNLNNQGSAEGFAFTFEGRTYKGHTSQYVEDGSVYGVKTSGQNWKRYVPPDYAGLQSMGEADAYVPFRFVVPALTGGTSVKFPYLLNNGNKMTEAVQMPGMLRMQLIPDQPAGLKLTGVTTDTIYGD